MQLQPIHSAQAHLTRSKKKAANCSCVSPAPAALAAGRSSSKTAVNSSLGNRFGTSPLVRMLLTSSRNVSYLICSSGGITSLPHTAMVHKCIRSDRVRIATRKGCLAAGTRCGLLWHCFRTKSLRHRFTGKLRICNAQLPFAPSSPVTHQTGTWLACQPPPFACTVP